ncbi:LysM peptidoglycan-binding domain-containing protein [Sulfurovum sp.]|uniref:LysM peptidoglycan-binding domain-containing protein n=1 Tax=Sulfurovum sp. TaxID=1969726 RepID=UPI0028681C14|nr:LysM peptidoglycan-binding domain-containing protein [Sulfurovum sp.]
MFKKYLLAFLLLSFVTVTAQSMVDCRVVTGDIVECNPYGKKFHIAQEISYDNDTKALIIVKTLPAPQKHVVKVISVEEMIEKYIHYEDSIRFKGTESIPLEVTVIEDPVEAVLIEKKIDEVSVKKKSPIVYGTYTVVSGDVLSRIAKKFGLTTKEIAKFNGLNNNATLRIGQKLKLPFDQTMVDAFNVAQYTVEEGDTLLSIAKKFNVSAREVVKFNEIRDATIIRQGKVLKLPLSYVLDRIYKSKSAAEKMKSRKKLDMIGSLGTHKLRVTATAYTSHAGQTDDTPFLAAWNNRLVPGEKSIAVSRDLLSRFGMRNGTKVRISGLRGYYEVRDKMNKRYKKRIDIYMGLNLKKALKWGKRSIVIYW